MNFVCCGRESGGVSDAEAAVPAPASSGEGNDGAEEIEAVADAENEEQVAAPEAKTAEAVPARATRGRSRRTVVFVPEDEVSKARRTSRRAVARKTSTEQEAEGKGTQGKNGLLRINLLALFDFLPDNNFLLLPGIR